MLCWAITSRPMVGSSRNNTSGECKQRGGQFHLHPLAERQFADRAAQQVPHIEQITQFVASPDELVVLDAINLFVERERFLRRQIPPELILLAHHQGKAAAIVIFSQPRNVPQHPGLTTAGADHAGEQLERRRLASAIGPQKGDKFALLDVEIDRLHGRHFTILAVEQPPDRGHQALRFSDRRGRTSGAGEFRWRS